MLLHGDSTTPGWVCFHTAGWVSFSTAWIWAVLWFVLAKIKKWQKQHHTWFFFFFSFPYLVLKRSIWFHCFLGTYYFQENRPSPPCWEMRPMTLYSLPHPFNYSWPADMSMNPSWTSQLPTDLLAFHRYTIENRQAKPTPTILKSNQMIMFSSLEFWSSLLHSNSWVTKISAYSGNPISENMLFSKTIWSFRFWCHLL